MLNKKNHLKLLFTLVTFSLVCGGVAFSKPKTNKVKEEAGFYYGYGIGSTKEEAEELAKKDLVQSAITSTVRLTDPIASNVTVSDECVKARLPKISPFKTNKTGTDVTYRIKVSDWDKEEASYHEKLRASLKSNLDNLNKGSVADRLNNAVSILNVIAENGVSETLKTANGATELLARKVENSCASIVSNLVFKISVPDGIVGPSTEYLVSVTDKNSKAISGLSVKIDWSIAYLPITVEGEEIADVIDVVTTDENGQASFTYPSSELYLNQIVSLTVSTAFSTSQHASKAMRQLDAESSVEGSYVYVSDINERYPSVTVVAGDYKTGSVTTDRRANPKEAAREVSLASYAIDICPVTNWQYAAYLFTTHSEVNPEYFDNYDYNQADQPVIGISALDAQAYAQWLSAQTGLKYRLPTDDEWEVAARAGAEVIYPWGDEDPSKAKTANYKGNGTYTATSPVGSFENGKNEWGLLDMSGNVWEWTSTKRSEESAVRTVKGGSWMDGPADLRISNFKNIDEASTYVDVGFRLVKEVTE